MLPIPSGCYLIYTAQGGPLSGAPITNEIKVDALNRCPQPL